MIYEREKHVISRFELETHAKEIMEKIHYLSGIVLSRCNK